MKKQALKQLFIGFDPDVTKTGVAFLSVFLSHKEWSLHGCELFNIKELILDTISDLKIDGLKNVFAKVETPRTDSANFGAFDTFNGMKKRFRLQGFHHHEKSAFNSSMKIANKKGRCSQVGEEIFKLLKSMDIETERISPSQRKRFDGFPLDKAGVKEIKKLVRSTKKYQYPSKMNHERFIKLIGIKDKTTNPEKRDAGLLLLKTYLSL